MVKISPPPLHQQNGFRGKSSEAVSVFYYTVAASGGSGPFGVPSQPSDIIPNIPLSGTPKFASVPSQPSDIIR